MLRVTTSYLNPKPSFDKTASQNPLSPLLNIQVPKSPDDQKLTAKRPEIRKNSESVDKIATPITSPSREFLNLRRAFKIGNSSERKINASTSPFKQNNLVFKLSENRIESSSPELEQMHANNRMRYPKPSEANELKAMNQMVEQFKKLSRDKHTEHPNSNFSHGLAIEMHRKKSTLASHLSSAIPLSNRDFQKKELPLNDVIHRKLGLDPTTKERQGSCFASNRDREFTNGIGGRKFSSHAGSLKEDNDFNIKYENILPQTLTNSNNHSLNNSEEQAKLPLTKQLSNLLMQSQSGSKKLKSQELDDLKAERVTQADEKQGNLRSDTGNFSFLQQEGELHNPENYPTRHSISLPDIILKEEGVSPKQEQTPMSCSSLEELIPFKNFLSHSTTRPSNDRKEIDQGSKTLSDNDKYDLKLVLSRVTETLNNDRIQMAVLKDENQRLNEEIQALKAKLREYEEKYP